MIHNKERDPYKEKHRRPKNNPTSELMPPFFPKIMSTGENTRKPGERHDNNENSKISEPQNKHKSYRSHNKCRDKSEDNSKESFSYHSYSPSTKVKIPLNRFRVCSRNITTPRTKIDIVEAKSFRKILS